MKTFSLALMMSVVLSLGLTADSAMADRSRDNEPRPALPDVPFLTIEDLTKFLKDQPYEIGFFAKSLATGKEIERSSDRFVCLASMVKVFCLSELYRQKDQDALDLSQQLDVPGHGKISLSEAADLMIGRSDNAVTQALAEFLGRRKVNKIPSSLGLAKMSREILPTEESLHKTLDRRISSRRRAPSGLPMHGTAKSMAGYYELLMKGQVISESVSEELRQFFLKHPKPFSKEYVGKYDFAGKGGNVLWTRPPKHFSMMGWGLFLTSPEGEVIVLCVWGEWFPEGMVEKEQSEFLKFVTDSVISILAVQS